LRVSRPSLCRLEVDVGLTQIECGVGRLAAVRPALGARSVVRRLRVGQAALGTLAPEVSVLGLICASSAAYVAAA
jgi:hypothetical protein